MSTDFTQALNKNMIEVSVYRAHKVSKEKLVFIEFTQSPKDSTWFTVLTELLMVNSRNHFWNSIYQAGSANEGIC